MEEYLKKLEETFEKVNEMWQQRKAEKAVVAACLIAEVLNRKLEEHNSSVYVQVDVEPNHIKYDDGKIVGGVDGQVVLSRLEKAGYKVRHADNITHFVTFE